MSRCVSLNQARAKASANSCGFCHEAARDLLVGRVHAQGHVGRGHHRGVALRRIVRVGHGACAGGVLGLPLVRAGRALRQLPLVAEQGLEVAVVPLDRVRGPGAFEAAGDRVARPCRCRSCSSSRGPAPRCRRPRARGRRTCRIAGAVGLAEGVAAGDERHGLLVVHRHAGEGLADVARRGERIRLAVRALPDSRRSGPSGRRRADCRARGRRCSARRPATWLPAPSRCPPPAPRRPRGRRAKPKVLKPIDSSATLPARIIRSAQEILRPYFCLIGQSRRRALSRLPLSGQLLSGAKRCAPVPRAAATVGDAVGAGAVPRHADEERPVVAVVRGPPVLRIRHQGMEVLDHGIQVEALELLGVVERLAHGIGQRGVLVQDLEVQLIGPPVRVRRRPPATVCLPTPPENGHFASLDMVLSSGFSRSTIPDIRNAGH